MPRLLYEVVAYGTYVLAAYYSAIAHIHGSAEGRREDVVMWLQFWTVAGWIHCVHWLLDFLPLSYELLTFMHVYMLCKPTVVIPFVYNGVCEPAIRWVSGRIESAVHRVECTVRPWIVSSVVTSLRFSAFLFRTVARYGFVFPAEQQSSIDDHVAEIDSLVHFDGKRRVRKHMRNVISAS